MYGYLGKLNNVNLNKITGVNGYFEISDPNVVSSMNNYPDDSNILFKLLYEHTKLNEISERYKKNNNSDWTITGEILTKLTNRHLKTYLHLSGTGEKCIKGVLEVTSGNVDSQFTPGGYNYYIQGEEYGGYRYRREGHRPTFYTKQVFTRFSDNVRFIRYETNHNTWTPWAYIVDEDSFWLLLADDHKIPKTEQEVENAFLHYKPLYDPTRLKNEINARATIAQYNEKLQNGAIHEASGTAKFMKGFATRRVIFDTRGRENRHWHVLTPEGHYYQMLRANADRNITIGQHNHAYVYFSAYTSSRNVRGATSVYWNGDMSKIQTGQPDQHRHNELMCRGNLNFSRFDGRWSESSTRPYDISDRNGDIYLDLLISVSTYYGLGTPMYSTFIIPANHKEDIHFRYDGGYSYDYLNGQIFYPNDSFVIWEANGQFRRIRFSHHRMEYYLDGR